MPQYHQVYCVCLNMCNTIKISTIKTHIHHSIDFNIKDRKYLSNNFLFDYKFNLRMKRIKKNSSHPLAKPVKKTTTTKNC